MSEADLQATGNFILMIEAHLKYCDLCKGDIESLQYCRDLRRKLQP